MPRPRSPAAPLKPFHPIVRAWFADTLGAPSEPQRQGWPVIAKGEHALILAPTGTGKTLAAFLWELDALIKAGADAPLPNAIQILYISPLKALNNDVQRNLESPLAQLRERFQAKKKKFPEIRVAVRTGDTPASARSRMVRRTPHILITTPESLYIMLTGTRARTMFAGVRAVIVDEIHAVAGTKRGAHLALTLERLEALCLAEDGGSAPQRIGLSATQRPLEEIAKFLGGDRPVSIVDCGAVKEMETSVVSPVEDLASVGGTVWPAVAQLVLRHVRHSRTTLVFVNNRAQAERVAARVNQLADETIAQPYHGSLARERRFELEGALKEGRLRALVTTSSLELGIDIGSVDLVLQLQSPKRVAAGLQRIGRAGHTLGATSRGVFVPTFRDDAMEIAVIVRAMRAGEVEPTRVVQNALDVLAQVVVAAASVDDWTSAELYALVRRAYPYHALTRAAFDEVLDMLAGKYPSDLASELEARITWDRLTDRISAGRGSRMTAVISGGTIPDRGLYTVNLPDRTRLGELDEEFVHESRVGDAFQLGSSTWRIAAIEHDRVVVTPAPGAPARMPFWHGEFMARSNTLTARIGELRRTLAAATTTADLERIGADYGCDMATATALAEYVQQQRAATGVVPDDRTVVIEQFRDEAGAVRIVLHAPFGGRVNAPWGMALAQRVRETLGRRGPDAGDAPEAQIQTTDDGIMLRLPDLGSAAPVQELLAMSPAEAEERVMAEVGASPLFGARFRMNAARALLLPRGNPRRRMPLWLQRLKALDLLQVVRQFPSFPILVETYRDVLQDGFDIEAMRAVLGAAAEGRIRFHAVQTQVPSPFAASLQFGFVIDWLYVDDTPRAERRMAALSIDRALLEDVMGEEGAEDDDLLREIERVLAERRGTAPGRRARTADELAVLLDRAGDLSAAELVQRVAAAEEGVRGDPVGELLGAGRVVAVRFEGERREAGGESVSSRGGAAAPPSSRGGVAAPPSSRGGVAAVGIYSEAATRHPADSQQIPTGPAGLRDDKRGPPRLRDDKRGTPRLRDDGLAPRLSTLASWRLILTEQYPRYRAAFGDRVATVRSASSLAGLAEPDAERPAADVVPGVLLTPSMTGGAARREVLARHVALAGPATAPEVAARYGLPDEWVAARLEEWRASGRLVAGRFRRGVRETQYCPHRVVDVARRRALAALRKAVEAVELPAFAAFLQRWQRVDPRDRASGADGTEAVMRQLAGLPRPGGGWERDYLPARLDRYDPVWLSQLCATGRLVWAGEGTRDEASGALALSELRFFERGTGAAWVAPGREARGERREARGERREAHADDAGLSAAGRLVLDRLQTLGASWTADLQAATGLSALAIKDALRELVAAGLATNDTVDAMREVVRAKPLPPKAGGAVPDPARWLPEGFAPSPDRPVVQRRPNLRRLPKWKRPDREGGGGGWVGRWSLVRVPGVLGPPLAEEEHAEAVARQWLERYGVVSRDWWRRERPPVSWRAIYRELKRLEYRGDVRRGYFVKGLAGAQFALPDAVERLRAAAEEPAPWVVVAASDPANVYGLRLEGVERPPLARTRGAGALLATRRGEIGLAAEGRGSRLLVAPGLPAAEVTDAVSALVRHLLASPSATRRGRDIEVRVIDGVPAATSPHVDAFSAAGFRRGASTLRYFESFAGRG